MTEFRALSASEQLANHLRDELFRGVWSEEMPGEEQLLKRLGVGHATVRAALGQLETEGLLVGGGQGRRRRIVLPETIETSSLRIAILCFDENDRASRTQIELFHSLVEQGNTVFFASKTLSGLGMSVQRISHLVKQTEADAWIVSAGSQDVLEWFVGEGIEAFALYGSQTGICVAGTGPNHEPALRAAVQRLAQLGHRRIVSLSNRGRNEDEPRYTERIFLEELEAQGLPWSSYNLPCWEDSLDGFRRCLESLFQHTPPTALLIEEATYFFAALQFCGDRRLRVPEDVSLVSDECPASFDFANPSIAHLSWDYRLIVRRIVRWAANIAQGKEDKRQTRVNAKFIEGGTIGPVPGRG